ncbi:hypothetical protein BpHYR1_032889 [Brachionus plicatilis]|uniref:Uncharacterized protein n=1 Tax=Brachionus plicatilis TaxID=10195 RepID=A0A3M7QKY0_BRAPC|nr:hypothetical protein BpHYR1_032889 [Brachionus plicatilis]
MAVNGIMTRPMSRSAKAFDMKQMSTRVLNFSMNMLERRTKLRATSTTMKNANRHDRNRKNN